MISDWAADAGMSTSLTWTRPQCSGEMWKLERNTGRLKGPMSYKFRYVCDSHWELKVNPSLGQRVEGWYHPARLSFRSLSMKMKRVTEPWITVTSSVVKKSGVSLLIAPSFNAISLLVAALTFDKRKLSASCARTGKEGTFREPLKMAFVIGPSQIDFSNNALTDALSYHRYADHNWKRKSAYTISFAILTKASWRVRKRMPRNIITNSTSKLSSYVR